MKQDKAVIKRRFEAINNAYKDLSNGKYPGRGYSAFAIYYKGDTRFWKTIGELKVIDFDSPAWIWPHPPSMQLAVTLQKETQKKYPTELVDKKKLRPLPLIDIPEVQPPKKSRSIPESPTQDEIVILWGLFKWTKKR